MTPLVHYLHRGRFLHAADTGRAKVTTTDRACLTCPTCKNLAARVTT